MLQPGSRSATGSGSPTAAKRKAAGAATAASASQGQPSGGQAGDAGVPGSPSKRGSAPDGLQGPQQQAAPAAGSADLMSLDMPDPPALQAAQVGVLLGGWAEQHLGNVLAQLSQICRLQQGPTPAKLPVAEIVCCCGHLPDSRLQPHQKQHPVYLRLQLRLTCICPRDPPPY